MTYEISYFCNSGFGVDRQTTSKRAAMREAIVIRECAHDGDSSAKVVVYALGKGPEPIPIAAWGQTCGGHWYRACV
jgi:hypothetical protein